MDYFEGLCLGPKWSDTDYANRRHFVSFFSLGLVVCALSVLYALGGYFDFLVAGDFQMRLWLLILLFVASPFVSFRYYRLPIFVKIPILLVQGLKIPLLLGTVTSYFAPMVTVSFDEVQIFLLEFINKTLEDSVNRFSSSAGSFSTIIGVVVGGLYFVLLFLGIFLAAMIVPGLLVLAYRGLQYGYDALMARFVLKRFMDK